MLFIFWLFANILNILYFYYFQLTSFEFIISLYILYIYSLGKFNKNQFNLPTSARAPGKVARKQKMVKAGADLGQMGSCRGFTNRNTDIGCNYPILKGSPFDSIEAWKTNSTLLVN